jgi:hypothetical protein
VSPVASWFRLFAGLAVVLALLTIVGPMDMAEDIRIEAVHKVMQPQRVREHNAGLDCPRIRDGLWLRLCIRHCPDGNPYSRWCTVDAYYGSPERRDIL